MRLGASAYLAHAPLAGPTFSAVAEAGAMLAFTVIAYPGGHATPRLRYCPLLFPHGCRSRVDFRFSDSETR